MRFGLDAAELMQHLDHTESFIQFHGDLRVKLAAQVLVTVEVVFGYVTLGLLISILANRIARRS